MKYIHQHLRNIRASVVKHLPLLSDSRRNADLYGKKMESEKRGQTVANGCLCTLQIHTLGIFVKMLEICLSCWLVHS